MANRRSCPAHQNAPPSSQALSTNRRLGLDGRAVELSIVTRLSSPRTSRPIRASLTNPACVARVRVTGRRDTLRASQCDFLALENARPLLGWMTASCPVVSGPVRCAELGPDGCGSGTNGPGSRGRIGVSWEPWLGVRFPTDPVGCDEHAPGRSPAPSGDWAGVWRVGRACWRGRVSRDRGCDGVGVPAGAVPDHLHLRG